MTTNVAFEDAGGKTRIKVRQSLAVLTPETEPRARGAKLGWTFTLNQLEEYCGGPARKSLQSRRSFQAPAERVFDAWVDPAQARRWLFATPTGEITRCELDARPGGSFILADRRDGEDVEHVGRYLAVERPRLLVFSFAVPKYSADETLVSIRIEPAPGGCELTLTHEGVLPEWAEKTQEGWGTLLAALSSSLQPASARRSG